jgi:hypothetical protein
MSPADYARLYDLMLEGESAIMARGDKSARNESSRLMLDLFHSLPEPEASELVRGMAAMREEFKAEPLRRAS